MIIPRRSPAPQINSLYIYIPKALNKQLSKISSNEAIFKEAAEDYKAPLKEAGYEHTLKFDPKPNSKNRKRQRTRNVLWFNPPYSIGESTRIGARFLDILDKCFKEDNPLSRILNRHTIKVSYRTTPNMKQIITGHNTHLLAKHKQQGQETEKKERQLS